MKILNQKKGMGLPMVLGITVFVIGLVSTLMTYIIFQAQLVETDIKKTDEYQNAVSDIYTAMNILSKNIEMDSGDITNLEDYLNVVIEPLDNGVIKITAAVDTSNTISSYMSLSNAEVPTDDVIFPDEDEPLSPLVTSENLLTEFIPEFTDSLNIPETDQPLETFDDVMNYMDQLADQGYITEMTSTDLESMTVPTITENTFISGNVDLGNQDMLDIDETNSNSILFVNGDLSASNGFTLSGNIVVNGDVIIDKNNNVLASTIYVSGNLTIGNGAELGTVDRPTFIFVTGTVTIGNNTTGNAYIIANSVSIGKNYTASGAIYTPEGIYYEKDRLLTFEEDLFSFAIPSQISVESGDGTSTDSDIVTTFPRVN